MPVFKYYRPDFYFEKAIRYDEIYFSSNDELNDPLDLAFTLCFSDNKEAWIKLLLLEPAYPEWDLKQFLDMSSQDLASDLNDVFKGSSLTGQKTIKSLIDSKKGILKEVIVGHINKSIESGVNLSSSVLYEGADAKADDFIHYLSEILSRGRNQLFYSSSFSKAALEPMMWAHYADGFKGCVLIYSNEEDAINLKPNIRINGYNRYIFFDVE